MSDGYPPVAFHFSVGFDDLGAGGGDVRFQSVSGLNASVETENVKEGGENRFTHVLPVRSQYTDLVLKRGVVSDSKIIEWCRDALEGFTYKPITVVVKLLDRDHEPLVTWNVVHAWPKKWSMGDLNAESSAVLIETLQLNYAFFTVEYAKSQTTASP